MAGIFDGREQGRRLKSARLPWSEDGGQASAKIAGESLTLLTRMPADKSNDTFPSPAHIHLLRRVICWMVISFALVLAVETALRIVFPWDMYLWPESPFMTNMLKLHHHLPVYSAPADGNSFVYSPGLEYLTFALLKPFGLELDIRFCRLVSTVLGIMAAGFGALAVRRLAGSTIAAARTKIFFVATWGVIWLVLSRNFLADITHPDNIHMFHATLIFWLCLSALETKRFGLAVLTILIAGLGVFTKQTCATAFLGPAAVFAIYNPWGWRRWLLLVALGGLMLGLSVWLLWLPEYGKFFTFDLPSRQGVWLAKSYMMAFDSLNMDRGLLVFLALIAGFWLWNMGGAARRYLICWAGVGFFSVLPAAVAYLKTMGMWNNLIIFEVWFIMLVWPFFGMLLDSLAAKSAPQNRVADEPDRRIIPTAIVALMVLFLVLIFPMKMPPRPGYYAYGRAIEAAVQRDIQAGRKVLVSHGTEFLIRSGDTEIPRDRANSILELDAGKFGSLSEMRARINARYYDRIYLIMGTWYGPDIIGDINRNYAMDSVISSPPYKVRLVYGYGELMEDCKILSPRPK